jgi:hypothetical protein
MRRKPGRTLAWTTSTLAVLALCCGPAVAATATTPPPSEPAATTEAAAGVTDATAKLYADVNPYGSPTKFYFQLGSTPALGTKTDERSAGGGSVAVRVDTPVTGLKPDTTYYYRVVASNAGGQVLGAVTSFTTAKAPLVAAKAPPTEKPTATTEAAADVTYTTANLYADVNPYGLTTTFYFQLGLTKAFTSNTFVQSAGAGRTALRVGTPVTELTPNTTYYYRVVADNAKGQAGGAIKTFKTPKVPLAAVLTNVPNPVPYGAPLSVEGTLTGSEAANHEVILEENPYPYTAGFQQVGNPLVTSPTGTFDFTAPGLSTDAQLRVVSVGGEVVASPVINEEVSVLISLHVRKTRHRGYVRLYGNVYPGSPGFPVGFQVLRHGNWVTVAGTAVRGGGAHYSRVIRLRHRGHYRAVVEVRGERTFGYSNEIRIR